VVEKVCIVCVNGVCFYSGVFRFLNSGPYFRHSKKRKGNPCGKGDVFFHLMWQKFLFPFLYCHILVLCLGHELGEIDIDLRKKHGLENSTQITQETLQRIIAGAERGDRGMKIHEI
jgi:hypothetical protein